MWLKANWQPVKLYVHQTKQILAVAGPESDKLHIVTLRSFYHSCSGYLIKL